MNLRWIELGSGTGKWPAGSISHLAPHCHSLPLTYQGTEQCCRTWFASRDPHRGCLQTEEACRCECGHGSHGHRCWSRGSRVTTHPRLHELWRDRKPQLVCLPRDPTLGSAPPTWALPHPPGGSTPPNWALTHPPGALPHPPGHTAELLQSRCSLRGPLH